MAGGKTIVGATTVKLTTAQANLATWQWGLWVQGGTPTDPVLANTFGTPENPTYGFATVRCADDALNGDNLEYIHIPTGVGHVFCYAYYVAPNDDYKLDSGGRVTITVKLTTQSLGAFVNRATVGTQTYDPDLDNNAAGQSIAVSKPVPKPSFPLVGPGS